MASIVAVGTAVPPFAMAQGTARELARRHFAGHIADLDRYLNVFENALVEKRHFCVGAGWFAEAHSFEARNTLYIEWAKRLAIAAIGTCLERAGVAADAIDHLVFVSSSGIATPSIDVAVIEALGLSPTVRRLPLFGLGCAGGAAGLALCRSLAADPGATVLVVAVELNSLTFQGDDLTKSNLVASSLFGDGAAAVLVRGGDDGPIRILDSATVLRRGTARLMGWDIVNTGFRVVFSRRVPQTIREMMPDSVGLILGRAGIGPDEIARFVFHPGGTRILEAYQSVLGRGADDFRASYDVLASFGNMSSATVLFVLDEVMRTGGPRSGDYGLLAAFGPGFSAEASLLRWT